MERSTCIKREGGKEKELEGGVERRQKERKIELMRQGGREKEKGKQKDVT